MQLLFPPSFIIDFFFLRVWLNGDESGVLDALPMWRPSIILLSPNCFPSKKIAGVCYRRYFPNHLSNEDNGERQPLHFSFRQIPNWKFSISQNVKIFYVSCGLFSLRRFWRNKTKMRNSSSHFWRPEATISEYWRQNIIDAREY